MPYPTKKLGDCLVRFDRGISWSRKDEGGTVAVLRIPNIQEGQINLDDLKYISAKNGNGELDKNDIAMVASNGNPDLVGRSALVTEREEGMRFASFLIRLRFDNTKLLSQYAHLFLLTPTFKRELRRKIATTSGIYNLKKEHIEKIKIPLPPLATQKQIVERLDKIAEAQKLNDDLIQKTDELFQSLLHQELSPAGQDWKVKKLGEMFERITESTLPTKQPDQWFNFIGLENMESNTGQIVGLNPTKGKLIKSTKTVFRKNDVLYGKLRPYLNKVWLSDTNGICSTDIWVLRAKQDVILPLLLSSILRQQRIVMKSSASMAGANLPRANKNVFDSIKVQLPPLEIQKQIVAKLSAVQEYKAQLLVQKSKLKELFDSALAKSMRKEQRI